MPEINRPLSPHLSVYKWQVSNTLSILHRATGVFLTLGAFVFAAWIVSAAVGPDAYGRVQSFLGGPLGLLLLFGLSASFFYHLGNGIRHLFWDAGYGFDKHVARLSGWITFLVSIAVTAAFWLGIAA
jgi:succinate dehydrogenase / fumarate reductase cytochrome b subunit